MKESAFSKQVRDDIKAWIPHAHIYLIQDAFRSGKKPYDFFFACGSRFYAIELKAVKGQSVPLDILRPHQVENLLEVDNCGVKAFGLVIMNVSGFMAKTSIILPITLWLEIISEQREKGNKSIKIKDLLQYVQTEPSSEIKIMLMLRERREGRTSWNIDNIKSATGLV